MTCLAAYVFFDTEFTSLGDPHLLSVGLVTFDGRGECYGELDLHSKVGQARLAATPQDVREAVIEDKWGLFPDSVCDSDGSLGQRVGEWLLRVAESDSGGRVRLLYDYPTDFELLVGALKECDLWSSVRVVASQCNVAGETGSIGPELASEACFRSLRRRQPPLYRHHSLADALALRAAWRTWSFVHQRARDFARLLDIVGREREGWLYEWLASPALALDCQVPFDVLDHVDGLQVVVDALHRVKGGCA
jgi:hypothetical protein